MDTPGDALTERGATLHHRGGDYDALNRLRRST